MRNKILLLFLGSVFMVGMIHAEAFYTNVSFSTNTTLQNCINNYTPPTGNVNFGGIPFSLGSTPMSWNSSIAAGGGSGTVNLDINVNIFGVNEVHTLISTWWGTTGNYASLTFYGSNGTTYTKSLYGNSDIRDYLNGSYTNSINGTTSTQVWAASIYRIDKQKILLPTAFESETLVKIRLSDWGNASLQRTFLSGVAVGYVPEPSTWILCFFSFLGICFFQKRKS